MPIFDRMERIQKSKEVLIDSLKNRQNKPIPSFQAIEIISQATGVRYPTAKEYLEYLRNLPEFDATIYEIKLRGCII